MRLLAAELGEHGIRVNGINPDGVVQGSGIFAGGWGANRAAVYGVEEKDLGAFYAQRTLLKREVLPEHVANAVVRPGRPGPHPDHRPAHPGRRRGRRRLPAGSRDGRTSPRSTSAPPAAGSCSARSARTACALEAVARFANDPVRLPDGLHWNIAGLYRQALGGLRAAVAASPEPLASVGDRLVGGRLRPAA